MSVTNITCGHCDEEIEGITYTSNEVDICESCHDMANPID